MLACLVLEVKVSTQEFLVQKELILQMKLIW